MENSIRVYGRAVLERTSQPCHDHIDTSAFRQAYHKEMSGRSEGAFGCGQMKTLVRQVLHFCREVSASEYIPAGFGTAEGIIPAFPLDKEIGRIFKSAQHILAGGGPGVADHISGHPTPDVGGIGIKAVSGLVHKLIYHCAAFQEFGASPVEPIERDDWAGIAGIECFR